ncbi:kinetochore complex Sim4 subunit Fta1-domain-containing protein [Aspergillus unguis]
MASPHYLLNTSWTSHRLSPLHYKTEASESNSLLAKGPTLDAHASRLRDHLTNSLDAQGWRAQDDPSAAGGLSAIGALQSCTWEPISSLSFLSQDANAEGSNEEQGPVGLLITLTYETTTYKAALLASPGSIPSQTPPKRGRGRPSLTSKPLLSSSIHLPLLLTRFPKPLRESFVSFLSSNFDTYVSPLRISSTRLCDVLQEYVESLPSSSSDGRDGSDAEDIIREMHLTLSFAPPIAPSLKALNINVPRETVRSFLRASASQGGSLLAELSAYVQKHLAMELGLPLSGPQLQPAGVNNAVSSLTGGYVRLTKIACAGFVITSEGRLKIVAKAEEGGEDDARNKGALRGGEALLRAVLERAGMGFDFKEGEN